MTDIKSERESTSLTESEALALGNLAYATGLTRSALLRLLALDGIRRYRPSMLGGAAEVEARAARLRLQAIADDVVSA
jgi:hypothetical protein